MTKDHGGVRDIQFMQAKKTTIADCDAHLRQGISGDLGFEVWGQTKDSLKIYRAVVEQGKDYGIRQMGGPSKVVHHVEAAFATPTLDFIPAIHGSRRN
ncbi:uncharacterized protein A1O9_10509 [Exophiala aquamarina CBS 119918]|uniref:GCVT N-terminal domain-containing protein n=1 Tax=Exophiala aquamarina CBS 119918 TaxID=1182545 RepID=A0A072P083_9EURO|nr:uncharacterized protein A1O9_10509 [Exophiala aquamarina CBS 119918]KEF53534.1 hypothetical protein A1O9_10509 [Exophiala aquamarina CBS 119918]